MGNVTRYLLLLLLLQACQQKPAETTTSPLPPAASPKATPAAAAPTLAQRLSPIMSGYWVSTEYLNEVARTRSPAASFDKVVNPASLAISPFTTQKDSVEIGVTYGLHEGGDMQLLLQPGTEVHSLKIKLPPYVGEAGTTNELAYQLTPTDTVLFYITRRTKTHRIISKNTYRRTGMPGNETNLEPAVERGVNNLLVTGNYIGKDSTNQPIKVQSFTGGLVKGLPFQKYSVRTDFTSPNPGDAIIFDEYTKSQQELAASFGRDTLKLYIINSTIGMPPGKTDTTEIFTRGRLRYQLVRTKKP